MKTLVISAVNIRKGGTLTILKQCLEYLSSVAKEHQWRVIAIVHRKDLCLYSGIEYIEIQRTPGYTDDTHYWLLVNIAEDGEKARWYYYDPTELRHDEYDHSGCLLTLAQLQAYDRVRPCFYLHDTASLPPVCEEIITPTPELSLGESWHEN